MQTKDVLHFQTLAIVVVHQRIRFFFLSFFSYNRHLYMIMPIKKMYLLIPMCVWYFDMDSVSSLEML